MLKHYITNLQNKVFTSCKKHLVEILLSFRNTKEPYTYIHQPSHFDYHNGNYKNTNHNTCKNNESFPADSHISAKNVKNFHTSLIGIKKRGFDPRTIITEGHSKPAALLKKHTATQDNHKPSNITR